MAKQRVYELARDLGLESKEVLARAQELGIEVKTASSGLDEDAAALVRLSFDETAEDSRKPPVPEPKPEAAVEGDLEALERNDFASLPGGLFNRGFVRAYCKHIGVDPEVMVNAYLLEERGLPVIELDTSEFRKMDGGLTCLSLRW